jgi:hypothetical protein
LLSGSGVDSFKIVSRLPEDEDEKLRSDIGRYSCEIEGADVEVYGKAWVLSLRITHGRSQSLTASPVEQPVARLDGIVDNVCAVLVLYLPQPEAHLGHLVAVIELDAGNVDHSCGAD